MNSSKMKPIIDIDLRVVKKYGWVNVPVFKGLKTIVLFAGMSISSVVLNASEIKKIEGNDPPDFKRVELGFRIMPTLSNFKMTATSGGAVKSEATLGFGIGGTLGFNITNHVGIQAEVIYNSLSQKYTDANLAREINVKYINIPLMLSLNTGKSKPVNLNFVFGPQLGINVGSQINSSGGSSTDSLTTVLAAKKSDFGFAYGAGLEFKLNPEGSLRLDTGFRGVYGLLNISNTSETNTANSTYIIDRANVRTRSLYLGLSLLF